MKKVSILLLALICASVVWGQQTVAVYVTGGENAAVNRIIGNKLVAAIAQNGKYTAVERTDDFLVQIQKEQKYQGSGAVNNNQISKLGEQFGVNFVCVAEMVNAFGSQFISARLINVETAVVAETADESGNINDMDALVKICNNIAKKLLGKEQAQSKVIASNPCEELQEEKPTLRAVGKGTNAREQTAKNIAEMQARAQFARALSSKIKTVTSENVIGLDFYSGDAATTEQIAKQEDFVKSVAEEIIRNTVIIKTYKEFSDNKYDIWVCLEYQGDIAKMADEIATKVQQQIPQKEKLEQFKKRMEKELMND